MNLLPVLVVLRRVLAVPQDPDVLRNEAPQTVGPDRGMKGISNKTRMFYSCERLF